jgi:hypothetical protein
MAEGGIGWEDLEDRRVTGVSWETSGSIKGGIFSLLASELSFSFDLVRCLLLGDEQVDEVAEEQFDATVELELLRPRFPSTFCIFVGIFGEKHWTRR